jgi:hypothetical protein
MSGDHGSKYRVEVFHPGASGHVPQTPENHHPAWQERRPQMWHRSCVLPAWGSLTCLAPGGAATGRGTTHDR